MPNDPTRPATTDARPCRYPECRCVASDGEGWCEATGEAIDALFDQGKPWSGRSHDRRQDDE